MESDVVDTILAISRRLAPKYTFGYYEVEDIVQEAFLIGMKAYESYEEGRPLENFLAVAISNRLKTFKRDNYCRPEPDAQENPEGWSEWNRKYAAKRNIMEPINFDKVKDEKESSMSSKMDVLSSIEVQELFLLIDRHLPVEDRQDYLKLLRYYEDPKCGIPLTKAKRREIEQRILEILEANGYEVW